MFAPLPEKGKRAFGPFETQPLSPIMTSVYLDYNASTPIATPVASSLDVFLREHYGNPSSNHWAGKPAKFALEVARKRVADLLGAEPHEIVFTSGGSESNNLALKGAFFALSNRGNHIITQVTEHPAVLKPLQFLERFGAEVTYLPVDKSGRVDPEAVRDAITPRTILISIMHANNETGTVQPIEDISVIARERGILFHSDAAQSIGKIPAHVHELGVDLLTIAGHKMYAPKGVGALYIRHGVQLESLIHGAGHEHGRRAGTESVLMASALGEASVFVSDLEPMLRVQALRDRLWSGVREALGDQVRLHGHPRYRLPNTLNVSFVGQIGADILTHLETVAASTGSACHAGRIELSPVLAAMGVTEHEGMGAVRFSLGRETTTAEIDLVVTKLTALAQPNLPLHEQGLK